MKSFPFIVRYFVNRAADLFVVFVERFVVVLADLVDRLCDSDHLVARRLDGHAQYSPRLVAGPQVHRRVEPIVLYIVSRRLTDDGQ